MQTAPLAKTLELLEQTRTYSLQGRVQVLDYPYAAPSKCVVCGSGPEANRKFIDFKQSLEFYGAVYYCTDCMGEVAQQVGYVPLQDLEDLKDSVRNMCDQYASDMAELEGYRDVFANLREYGIGVPDISSRITSLTKASSVVTDNAVVPNLASAGQDSGSNESSSGEGSNDVPSAPTHKGKRKDGL